MPKRPPTKTKGKRSAGRGASGLTSQASSSNGVTAKWRKLFKLIPGYDPEAGVDPDVYWFDVEEAERRVAFFPACIRHIKGPEAGNPYELAPHEMAIVGCAFGWKRRRDGMRRYRQCFLYIPKKNSKTTLACGVMLCHMTMDLELGGEYYSAGSTRDQAAIVFEITSKMVQKVPELAKAFRIYGAAGGSQQRAIIDDEFDSFYRPLSSDASANDGANVFVAVIDELHRHKDDGELADLLIRGTSARQQPFTWIMTTADHEGESACNRKHAEASRVRDNGGDPDKPGYDMEFLPVIFEAPKDADWTDPAIWAIANPNLGRSKTYDYMEKACRKAQEDESALEKFLRLDLNIQTQSHDSLIPMVHWDQCPTDVDAEALLGATCYGGLDLAQRQDIAAFALAFPPDNRDKGEWKFLFWLWCCESTNRKRQLKAIPYQSWRDKGWLIETEGDDIDFEVIKRTIGELNSKYTIVDVGYDPYNAAYVTQAMYNEYGMTVTEMRQGPLTLSEPTKQFRSMVITHRCNHGGSPAMRWQAANAMGKFDDKENVIPSKKNSKDKIDGIAAAIMAVGRALDGHEFESGAPLIACAG